ncbi:MAG: TatD family hydrolase [Gammaproteobacteria bacterium]|nr:TatD family hydrolase [Gammaproteobacteria bacterium]
MLIDSHCHLDFSDFQEDLDTIVKQAIAAGVTRMISIGTTLESSQRAIALAETYDSVFAAVGHHPCNYEDFFEGEIEELTRLCQHPKVVAIGECGLDYHHLPDASDFESSTDYDAEIQRIKTLQKRIFTEQLDLAVRENLNVVVHQRNSWDDCVATLSPYHGKVRTVFHCFSESTERAMQLIQNNHLVSFTGIATFKKLDDLRHTISQLPAGSFMVETDAPYLAPVPNRGKRCEPAMVADTAQVVATARNLSLEEVAKETTATAEAFFRFP